MDGMNWLKLQKKTYSPSEDLERNCSTRQRMDDSKPEAWLLRAECEKRLQLAQLLQKQKGRAVHWRALSIFKLCFSLKRAQNSARSLEMTLCTWSLDTRAVRTSHLAS